jgi:hypothetical protein
LELCDGQQWFFDEVEEQLNHRQLSVYTIKDRTDLDRIVNFGKAGAETGGKIPRAIGELRELRHIFLSGNKLSGEIPPELYTLEKLESLDLTDNLYKGEIPGELGGMDSLRSLLLAKNAYSGTVPAEILANVKLKILDVSSNKLTGPIPPDLNNMTSLEYLGFSDNPFDKGELPDFSDLQRLKTLSAWGCNITGDIPADLYELASLQILDMYGNGLTGELGAGIGDMTLLEYVSVGDNELTGELPSSLGNLTNLKIFDISDNEFKGPLPDVFGGMNRLESIHLENNRLIGHVPATLKAAYDNGTEIFFMNNYMTGDDLSAMPNNQRNFADEAQNAQYRLMLPSAVRVNVGTPLNIYQNLTNAPLRGASYFKPLLPAEAYGYRVTGDPEGKLTVTRDENGIYVTLAETASLSERITIEIYIIGNDGSEYSVTGSIVTTDVLPLGSGGAGGGFATEENIEPDEERPVETHVSYINGYTSGDAGGYANSVFKPNSSVSREEVAKMMTVLKLAGFSSGDGMHIAYLDVSEGRWSSAYIQAAADMGYFEGYPDGNFRPGEAITRAEFTAVIVRASGVTVLPVALPEDLPFTDTKDEGAWYLPYLRIAVEKGYIEGYPDGTFRPNEPVSRAEAVKMLNLFYGRDPESEPGLALLENPFDDLDKSHWAYLHIIEASVTHEHETERETTKGADEE